MEPLWARGAAGEGGCGHGEHFVKSCIFRAGISAQSTFKMTLNPSSGIPNTLFEGGVGITNRLWLGEKFEASGPHKKPTYSFKFSVLLIQSL